MLIPLRDRRSERFAGSANNTTDALHVPRIYTWDTEGCFWTWDEPLRLLSISDNSGQGVRLPLDALNSFVAASKKFDDGQLALLARAIDAAAREVDLWNGSPPWPLPLDEAIGLLLMFIVAAKRTPRMAALVEAATAMVARFPASSPAGAWRALLHKHLPFAHRASALAAACDAQALMPTRELAWWTARCRLNLAMAWCGNRRIDDGEAARELIDAAAAYIQLLQTEPSRRAMESFYAAAGTSSEREVLRAHAAREEYTTVDDVVRADVTSWLLRRYSLYQSWKLLRKTLRPVEKAGAAIGALLVISSLGVFLLHTFPRTQVTMQVLGFIAVVFMAPRLFSLLLPRAMFGTLLAWIMVVLAQTASLLPIVPADTQGEIHKYIHDWLVEVIAPRSQVREWVSGMLATETLRHPPAVVDFAAIILGFITISMVFLMVEVSDRLSTRIFWRSIYCVLIMLAGSLFWGAMLVPMLQYIVVRERFGNACDCVYPAWILGSVCAVSFGILVQLMWDDHAISDSLGVTTKGD